jgi:hypothetical protein
MKTERPYFRKVYVVEKIVELNCKLIDPSIIEKDFELIKELEIKKGTCSY